jgi:predicted MFS family arabinose efflux permease
MTIPAAAGLLAAVAVLDERRMRTGTTAAARSSFDWPGALLIAGGVVALVLAITRGPDAGWGSPDVWGVGLAAAGVLLAFGWHQLRIPRPLFDLRLLTRPALAVPMGAYVLSMSGFSAPFFLVPFYVQGVLGHSASALGLILLPGFLCYALTASLAGRLSDRFGTRPFMVGGPLVAILGTLGLAALGPNAPAVALVGALVVHSIGMASFVSPNFNAMLRAVPASVYSRTMSFTSLLGTVAGVLSVALATAIVSASMRSLGVDASIGVVEVASPPETVAGFLAGTRIAYLVVVGLLAWGASLALAYRTPTQPDESLVADPDPNGSEPPAQAAGDEPGTSTDC